jgi:hypothetical protein
LKCFLMLHSSSQKRPSILAHFSFFVSLIVFTRLMVNLPHSAISKSLYVTQSLVKSRTSVYLPCQSVQSSIFLEDCRQPPALPSYTSSLNIP